MSEMDNTRFFVGFLGLMAFLLVGCSEPTVPEMHLSGNTMGTTYNVKFVDDTTIQSETLQGQIDQRLFEINKLMSTYDPESELSRFNQNRFVQPIEISPETSKVITEALRLGELSNGALDVTVGPLVNLWGFGPQQRPETVPTDNDIESIRDYVGLDKIVLSGTTLTKRHPLVYVDLSTIAKGYAVDELANILIAQGITNFLVEIGGEMRVKGQKRNGQPWRIAIEKPVTNERAIQQIVSIGDNAVATSGDYRNYYEENGVRYSHLIDPVTGKPIQHDTVAVTVVDPSSMVADGLATAFMVMDWQQAMELCEANNIAALLIRKEGDAFREYRSTAFEDAVDVH